MSKFKKATKEQAKLRAAIFGPSGSGKTFTALRIATGMGSKIAVIDTERGTASKYADRFEFDVLDLDKRDITDYCSAIKDAASEGYNVLIIDSLSHAWQELLQEIDRLAKTKFRGNTWSAWSEGTPKQHQLVNALLDYPGHVIATMRSKTEWTQEQTTNGKTKPVRVGLAPEQGKGIEYEFDLLLELSVEHFATVIKDRTGRYQDKIIEKPGEDFGKELIAWLSEGAVPTPKVEPPISTKDKVLRTVKEWSGVANEDVADAAMQCFRSAGVEIKDRRSITADQWALVYKWIGDHRIGGKTFVEATSPEPVEAK